MKQLTNRIIMIRPANFGYNVETAVNNAFQTKAKEGETQEIQSKAIEEFDAMVESLVNKGIKVRVIQDTEEPKKPDAVFPNNWISLHEGGILITYPMFAKNRRIERREDLIEQLENDYEVKNRYSFEFYEDEDELFLEGTGSMIFDRENRFVYACLSQRTDATLIDKFNVLMNTQSCVFRAVDHNNKEIYHTNVMMALGKDFVVICMDSVVDDESKKTLRKQFELTGKAIIEISYPQMNAFAGNMLEVLGSLNKRYLVLSQTAYDSLTNQQIEKLSSYTTLLPIAIPTIEKYGGGSVRCMMAENFLPERK